MMFMGTAAAVVGQCLLGFLWYHPKTPSGGTWLRHTHPSFHEMKDKFDGRPAIVISIASMTFFTLLLKFILLDFMQAKVLLDGVKFALGLSCMTTLLDVPHTLFAWRRLDVFIIDHLFNAMCAALAAASIMYFN